MFVTAAITLVCTAGVSFYVRFLVALCKECRPHRIGYWVRLRLNTAEEEIAGRQERLIPNRSRHKPAEQFVTHAGHVDLPGGGVVVNQPHAARGLLTMLNDRAFVLPD